VWPPGGGGGASKYYTQTALSVGANVITHSLALAIPKTLQAFVTNDATGEEILLPITSYGANADTLTAVSAVASVNVTIVAAPVYYTQAALSAGANVITHSLALATPKAVSVQVFDNATGERVLLPITAYGANSITFNAPTAVAPANITVLGSGAGTYYTQAALSAGANVITHSLSLVTPKSMLLCIFNDATGEQEFLPITAYASGSITVNSTTAFTGNVMIIS
jgi:hypothetical protein